LALEPGPLSKKLTAGSGVGRLQPANQICQEEVFVDEVSGQQSGRVETRENLETSEDSAKCFVRQTVDLVRLNLVNVETGEKMGYFTYSGYNLKICMIRVFNCGIYVFSFIAA